MKCRKKDCIELRRKYKELIREVKQLRAEREQIKMRLLFAADVFSERRRRKGVIPAHKRRLISTPS